MVHNLSPMNLENIVNSIVFSSESFYPVGTGQGRGGETESVTVETTTDYSGIEQTMKLESRIKGVSHYLLKHFP